MDPKIITNVEFKLNDIPNGIFRGTHRISMQVNDEGLIWNGELLTWGEIKSVEIKTFNGNPYLKLQTSTPTKPIVSFYFLSKWWKRHKNPWFGASSFLTLEFLKILEEKTNICTYDECEQIILQNTSKNPFIQKIWNTLFWIIPPSLAIFSVFILYLGYNA
ncbi:MAG: hypothetical protein ACXAC7_03975 [Candidatus Hodarchaeales archaeon]|jgi:hypothetical protein